MILGDLSTRLENTRGILFDLDNTLYPRERGVFSKINEKIDQYVTQRTGRSGEEVRPLRQEYIHRYGTTLGGLMRHHQVDPDEYMDFVHDVPVEEMLSSDEMLDSFLASIDLPKVIFTNASTAYASRVLSSLGVEGHFKGVVDLAQTNYLGKPHESSYQAAARQMGHAPAELLFVDDLQVNVESASRLGILTAHIADDGNGTGDISVSRVTELGDFFEGTSWFSGG